MSDGFRGAAAIVGIGLTEFGDLPGRSKFEIMGQAVHRALNDAGIAKDQVDAVFAADFNEAMMGLTMAEYLGVNPKYIDSTNVGGSSYVNFLQSASMAIQAGLCEVALIAYGSNARSAGRAGKGPGPVAYESVYKPRPPINSYALAASRHMYEYGTTREQLAEVAVAARGWAQKNPAAFMRGPLTIDDVLTLHRILRRMVTTHGVHGDDYGTVVRRPARLVMIRHRRRDRKEISL